MAPPPKSTFFPNTTFSRSGRRPPARHRPPQPGGRREGHGRVDPGRVHPGVRVPGVRRRGVRHPDRVRSEEHTSELQSRQYLVCRLLLEKKTATRNKSKKHR